MGFCIKIQKLKHAFYHRSCDIRCLPGSLSSQELKQELGPLGVNTKSKSTCFCFTDWKMWAVRSLRIQNRLPIKNYHPDISAFVVGFEGCCSGLFIALTLTPKHSDYKSTSLNAALGKKNEIIASCGINLAYTSKDNASWSIYWKPRSSCRINVAFLVKLWLRYTAQSRPVSLSPSHTNISICLSSSNRALS